VHGRGISLFGRSILLCDVRSKITLRPQYRNQSAFLSK
jgi:hypothetical protein